MPRIDLWAIDRAQKAGSRDNDISSEACEFARVSEVWSTFVEQVDSACTSMSTIILVKVLKFIPYKIQFLYFSFIIGHIYFLTIGYK